MGQLFATIRRLVIDRRYIIGQHASERLEERGILEWQVADGMEKAELLFERPRDLPNPAIETRQLLADGTEIKAVWSHIIDADVAKLVTVHFLD
ncbi:MAG TPA: DUF4258 domain-containing protein [Tepidisphaeraceae bacterium]|jgi:hypothetical protein